MAADPLLERLQRAVSPDYRVERELGGGGWGRVCLAYEFMLKREVAIKVLRPELASAAGAEAFLREARILASARHPNIVVIHRTGEGEGLQYYIMELVNGPTLAQRLETGALSLDEALQLGIDLLHGLETVHRLGLAHRDVKPSNVFLLPERAVLGDFGIALAASDASGTPRYATPGQGTPGYWSPEQEAGGPITPRSDIYSTGVLLYETLTGRVFPRRGEPIAWDGIPRNVARVLRRAVAEKPEERLPDAAAFRRALEGTRAANIPLRVTLFIATGLLAGALLMQGWQALRGPATNPGALEVGFDKIDYVGPPEHRHVADSLLRRVRSDLEGHPDFILAPTRGFLRRRPAALAIQARIAVTSGEADLQLTGGIPAHRWRVPFELWPALRDSITYRILLGVWDKQSPLAASLPVGALPRTSQGLLRFLEAERLVADAQWENAHRAYLLAERTDSTCLICSWRITEIERWLGGGEHDPARARRYLDHIDAFPTWYASLIRAAQLPLRARFDTLRAVTESQSDFFLGWFQLGDELFHRGPLAGHRRAEAISPLERTASLRPDFGPAWEHLAWVTTAEDDSTSAARALDSLGTAHDAYSMVLRSLLRLGFAWRFLPEPEALRLTKEAVGEPTAQSSAVLGAGPRMLPSFEASRGAIALGRILESNPSRDLQRSGLIAQTLGSLAVGQIGAAQDLARRLTDIAPEAEIELFAAELQGALAILDDAGGITAANADRALRPWIAGGDIPQRLRYRAVWMSALLQHRSLLRSDAPRALSLLITADSLAAAGRLRAALAIMDTVDVDAAARRVDPFFRTIVHLQRAGWRARTGDIEGARSELLWHEHNDIVGLPTGLPQAAEIDWAFGALAQWRLARLLDTPGAGPAAGDTCRAYAAVVRQWSQAPAPYGARADTAQRRADELNCPSRQGGI
jgi:serine/threonine-protein kinase